MQSIEIDFDVFKALTALRASEADSYNDVIRCLLKLPAHEIDEDSQENHGRGRMIGGRFLPHGSKLRAKYKGKLFHADIIGEDWVDSASGKSFGTASAAARAITQTNVNGLVFWEVRRPADADWQLIKSLPKTSL